MKSLPEDIFHSYWNYLFNEVVHYLPIMVVVLIIVGLVLSMVHFRDSKPCVHVLGVLLFLTPFALIVPICFFREQLGDRNFQRKLLVEVITRKPAVKGKEWKTITYNMNQYLFVNNLWNTPYYFYRDEDCHRYFLSLIEGHTFKKQDKSSINSVKDVQRTEFFTFSPGPNYQVCLSKAAEIEQRSQNYYWRQQYPGIGALL
ncbi:SMKI01G0845 [Saccharomyces mikatae IFO 1815]|uniref:SMKI01G0845 protein n=1 Tax=Saccharomyces mikatae IFO 1815 TaxID=226126 RepID=A0AA35NFZ3_SACMI|nr:uncharacterized protein SMKI_01G0845 [Saccharomyces mikatae IFO 1815]CAI4037126.1 SMKI01G0845 [Saccharomyces mikatae IFO 1815]